MLSANNFSEFLQRKRAQLQEVEDQCDMVHNNILENKCAIWLDSLLSRTLLAYGLIDRDFVAFRIERKDKTPVQVEDFIPTVRLCNKVIRNCGSLVGITYGADFPSTDEQAEILCHAFQNWQKIETLFQEKGYRVEVKTYGNRDRDLIVYLEQ